MWQHGFQEEVVSGREDHQGNARKVGCGKRKGVSNFLRPSVDFAPFWTYILNLDKGSQSLTPTRYSKQSLTISNQPLHSVTISFVKNLLYFLLFRPSQLYSSLVLIRHLRNWQAFWEGGFCSKTFIQSRYMYVYPETHV